MTAVAELPKLHHRSYYGEMPLTNPRKVVRRARKWLKDVDFDTVVATGMSGVTAATLIGSSMGKNVLLVRKPDDQEHHSGSQNMLGVLGKRWVFVDDFISSGATRTRVREEVDSLNTNTEYVGAFLYGHAWGKDRWVAADDPALF